MIVETTPPARERAADPAASVAELTERFAALWRATPAREPRTGPPIGRGRRWSSGRAARLLIDDLARRVETLPADGDERRAWRRATEERVRVFGERHLGWPRGYRDLLLADGFHDSSLAFARRARAARPDLDGEELFQALRNVWIANSLQMLLDLPVELTPSVFAYSMLYPLTDNLLDDPAVADTVKRRANDRLGRRLVGERLAAECEREAAVFTMVRLVESDWPREAFPRVHGALRSIHRGQVRSLRQHDAGRPLSNAELLAVSIEKGGSSVLADGYVAAGRLTEDEATFCFGFGALLQLLDDLQDVEADRRHGHETLFTRAAAIGPLDETVSRLHAFIERALTASPRFATPRHEQRLDLLRRNCTWLLVASVAASPRLFTRDFSRRLERRWPLGFRRMRRLQRRARKRFTRARRRLAERRGAESLFELL